jgi:hypothetical protein
MKVDYLFIIGIIPSVTTSIVDKQLTKDTLECMSAIFDKYKNQCKSTMTLAFKYPQDFRSFLN